MAALRQKEKREDIKEVLRARGYDRVWDMSSAEQDKQYFEGTGVLVLDRVNGVAYVNISERAHADLAQRWADHLGYEVSALPSVPGQTCPLFPLILDGLLQETASALQQAQGHDRSSL